jgi:hypothetical protein
VTPGAVLLEHRNERSLRRLQPGENAASLIWTDLPFAYGLGLPDQLREGREFALEGVAFGALSQSGRGLRKDDASAKHGEDNRRKATHATAKVTLVHRVVPMLMLVCITASAVSLQSRAMQAGKAVATL